MQGDIDNIVKPILDALSRHIFLTTYKLAELWSRNLNRETSLVFQSPTNTFAKALEGDKPVLYIRVTNDPHEELR